MPIVEVSNEVATEEEQKQFVELLGDENKKAITHVITLKLTEFVDMQEFNSMQISAGEFNKKQVEYLQEHSKCNQITEMAQGFADKLAELGLFKESTSVSARPYDIGKTLINELSSILKNISDKEQDDPENNEQETENTDSLT